MSHLGDSFTVAWFHTSAQTSSDLGWIRVEERGGEVHDSRIIAEICTNGTRTKGLWWCFGEGKAEGAQKRTKSVGMSFLFFRNPKVIRVWVTIMSLSDLSESSPVWWQSKTEKMGEPELIGEMCWVATLLKQFEHLTN